jgi:hypothetical protein
MKENDFNEKSYIISVGILIWYIMLTKLNKRPPNEKPTNPESDS